MGSGEGEGGVKGLRGEGGDKGWWGRVLTPKSKKNKPPSHLTKRNQSWLLVFQSGILCKAEMGSRRLYLWLIILLQICIDREKGEEGRGIAMQTFPPTPRCPPPPLRARVISKGVGCCKSQISPSRGGKAEHRLSPPPCLCKLQQPRQPPAFV